MYINIESLLLDDKFNKHFHNNNRLNWVKSMDRDDEKQEWLRWNNIKLVELEEKDLTNFSPKAIEEQTEPLFPRSESSPKGCCENGLQTLPHLRLKYHSLLFSPQEISIVGLSVMKKDGFVNTPFGFWGRRKMRTLKESEKRSMIQTELFIILQA